MFFIKSLHVVGLPRLSPPGLCIDKDWTVPRAQAVSENNLHK
jgi:hypothetical protein